MSEEMDAMTDEDIDHWVAGLMEACEPDLHDDLTERAGKVLRLHLAVEQLKEHLAKVKHSLAEAMNDKQTVLTEDEHGLAWSVQRVTNSRNDYLVAKLEMLLRDDPELLASVTTKVVNREKLINAVHRGDISEDVLAQVVRVTRYAPHVRFTRNI